CRDIQPLRSTTRDVSATMKSCSRGHLAVIVAAVATSGLWSSELHADPSVLPPSFASNYGENETPRSAAMGGALHALGAGTTAPFLNPANMGLTRVYHVQALGQFMPEANKQLYGATVVDSSRRLSGGFSFVGGLMDPDGVDRSVMDGRISVAFAIAQQVHLGLTGRYLNISQQGLGPLGTSRASGGLLDPDSPPSGRKPLINDVSFDAGLTVKVTPGLNIAAFGHNLSYPNHGFLPTVVGGALGYANDQFALEVDGVADLSSYTRPSARIMGGGEYMVAGHVPLALGYRFDLLDPTLSRASHQLSAGMGYVSRQFGLRVAVRRTLVGPSATSILASVSYHLESSGAVAIQPY
ncbi:MAG: hypothetical protein VB934_01835, partial [Polyangiaceae bacterium]